jgi:nitrite reductase/ring-hydroxylating ferredoxin subunit
VHQVHARSHGRSRRDRVPTELHRREQLAHKVVDIIAADRTYQGQTFSDEMHFVCPWHGYEYDLKTGQCMGDSKLKLKRFDVVRRGDDIYVVA